MGEQYIKASNCCHSGFMAPEEYIFYNGEDSLSGFGLAEVDWICVKCGKPCEVIEFLVDEQ